MARKSNSILCPAIVVLSVTFLSAPQVVRGVSAATLDRRVLSGRDITFDCERRGGLESYWEFRSGGGDPLIIAARGSLLGGMERNYTFETAGKRETLTLLRSHVGHNGRFTCGSIRNTNTVFASYKLWVMTWPTRLSINSTGLPQKIEAGNTTLNLSCTALGGDPQPRIFWRIPDGTMIQQGGEVESSKDLPRFVTSRLSVVAGTEMAIDGLTCVAEASDSGYSKSAQITIPVQFSPKCEETVPQFYAPIGGTENVSCSLLANPLADIVTLSRNNIVLVRRMNIVTDGYHTSATASYTVSNKSDYGKLTCETWNEQGTSVCEMLMLPAEPFCTYNNLSLKIDCDANAYKNSGVRPLYILQTKSSVSTKRSTWVDIMTTDEGTFDVGVLGSYTVRVCVRALADVRSGEIRCTEEEIYIDAPPTASPSETISSPSSLTPARPAHPTGATFTPAPTAFSTQGDINSNGGLSRFPNSGEYQRTGGSPDEYLLIFIMLPIGVILVVVGAGLLCYYRKRFKSDKDYELSPTEIPEMPPDDSATKNILPHSPRHNNHVPTTIANDTVPFRPSELRETRLDGGTQAALPTTFTPNHPPTPPRIPVQRITYAPALSSPQSNTPFITAPQASSASNHSPSYLQHPNNDGRYSPPLHYAARSIRNDDSSGFSACSVDGGSRSMSIASTSTPSHDYQANGGTVSSQPLTLRNSPPNRQWRDDYTNLPDHRQDVRNNCLPARESDML